MHTLRNRLLFFGSALAAGFASLGLYRYMLANCVDAKGLLIAGNLPAKLLWVVGIGFAVCLGAMLTTIGGDGSYEDNFPRCSLSGGLMIAAGCVLWLAVPQLGIREAELTMGVLHPVVEQIYGRIYSLTNAVMKVLPNLAAAAMVILGVCRMAGRKPNFLFSCVICLFYMLMLVTNYRLWSADPQFHDYAYRILAGVTLMLCSFHRACCDAGVIQRRKLLFTGLTAAMCAIASISPDFMPGFFAASALWALGSMCSPAVLPPDPEEEDAAESADALQVLDEQGDMGDSRE